MREIKFRGKRIDNGEWCMGDFIHGVNHKKGKTYILPIRGGVMALGHGLDPLDGYEVIPESVGQLMKSYNGINYFIGDIAQTKDEYQLTVVLCWIKERCMCAWLTPDEMKDNEAGKLDFDNLLFWSYAFSDESTKDLLLVGNVIENPETITSVNA